MAQPTKRKFRVQWTIGDKLWTAGHGAAFFKDQQPVSLVIPPPPLPNVATQNARPALYNEDFGRERDIEELQNEDEDEADELMLSGEQHVEMSTLWSRMGRNGRCSMLEFQFASELQQDWA